MPAASLLKYCYLAYFSQPKAERAIYRAIRQTRPTSIVELGVGKAVRTRRMLEVARRYQPAASLRYTGIDLFEARTADSSGLALKQAHKLLADSGAKVQLVPGDPLAALSRTANTLTQTDVFLIGGDQDPAALAKAWFYAPRMLHDRSLVLLEEPAADGQAAFRRLSLAEVAALAAATTRQVRRAA